MFCHWCTNNGLNGCLTNSYDKCRLTQEKLDKIFSKIEIEDLKKCGELPYNFKRFILK